MNLFSPSKQYPAFTLIELMVGMIASGIVLSAIWMSFRIVSRLQGKSVASKYDVQDISLFKRVLYSDFNRADSVASTDHGFRFISETDASGPEYKLGETYVVRIKDEHSDSFNVRVSNHKLNSADDQDDHAYNGMRTIQFTLRVDGAPEHILLAKNSTAVEQMKQND